MIMILGVIGILLLLYLSDLAYHLVSKIMRQDELICLF